MRCLVSASRQRARTRQAGWLSHALRLTYDSTFGAHIRENPAPLQGDVMERTTRKWFEGGHGAISMALGKGEGAANMRPRRPTSIHLAAQSFVGSSWPTPEETLANNTACQINLLGTSEEYGLVYPDELQIKETNPLRPLSPYAVSKGGTGSEGLSVLS